MKKDDLNKKQRYALDTMLSGSNVFLTGDAGTGKTTVIQTFIDEAEKAGKNILVSATTGIAADNIGYGATTVHRALNISIKFEDYKKKVKLAWAISIHKSQGQTFEKINIDPCCWDPGQFYVAVSRARSADGIHFIRPIKQSYIKAFSKDNERLLEQSFEVEEGV